MNTTPARPSRRTVLVFLLMAAGAAFAAGAGPWGETIRGNGTVRTQERAVSGFRGIALALPAQVELRMGAAEGVSIEADENILPHVEAVVKGGTLQLRAARRVRLDTDRLRIMVNARQIEQIAVAGGGTIRAAQLQAPRLGLEIGGAGKIAVGALQAESVDASVGGSGSIQLAGAARRLTVAIAGSGDVDAPQLKADEVSVNIAGSGDAAVWPVESLQSSIAGSGDVRYWGDPKSNRTKVAGSGAVTRAGAAPR